MAKKQNYRPCQSTKGGHFLALYDDMVESKAWEQLTANDTVLYIAIAIKFKPKYINGILVTTNENDLSIVKKEYLKLMHQTTFFKAIDHLIDLGFIKVVESRYALRESTIYGLSNMWYYYDTNEFIIKNECKRVKNRTSNVISNYF